MVSFIYAGDSKVTSSEWNWRDNRPKINHLIFFYENKNDSIMWWPTIIYIKVGEIIILFLFIEFLEAVDIGSKVLWLIKIWKVIWSGYLKMASPYIILA